MVDSIDISEAKDLSFTATCNFKLSKKYVVAENEGRMELLGLR